MKLSCYVSFMFADVLVSTSDGMYSLQNTQSRNQQSHMQNEMLLPQEWTYWLFKFPQVKRSKERLKTLDQ